MEKLALLKGNELDVKTINDVVDAFEVDLSSSWENSIKMDNVVNQTANNKEIRVLIDDIFGKEFKCILKGI